MAEHKPKQRAHSGGKAGSGHAPVLKRRKLPNWPVGVLAVAGMLLTGYLTITTWSGDAPAFCAEGSSCEVVQGSRWGTLFALPVSFWGFLAYAALGHIAFRVRDPERHWKFAWTIALLGTAISLYLTFISLIVIEATCIYCLVSLGLMTATFAVVTVQWPAGLPGFSWPAWATQAGLVAVVVVSALHLHYGGWFASSAGPEDPYLKGLAEHLTRSGVVFYGAYW